MENWLDRTEKLIGKENINKLENSNVIVFGCGGVGSYVIEGLVRSGIGNLIVVDHDVVDITNINRQLIADTTTLNLPKVDAIKQRALKINPNIKLTIYKEFADKSNLDQIIPPDCKYIVDAIDSISSKIEIIEYANSHCIPIISCMGTGNKLDPTILEISDISKTSVCPLAKVVRKELRNRDISHLKVVYSKEEPKRFDMSDKSTPASISFVPSVAGLIIAGEVIKDLTK